MLTKRVIPCLDIRNNRVVKGVRFQGLRDAGDPIDQARRYQECGADELVMLDVTATNARRIAAEDVVRALRSVLSIPLTVGGGVRSVAHARSLLAAGADKVAINSAAVQSPELITMLQREVGAQCVVLSLDASRDPDNPGRWRVVTHAGTNHTQIDAIEWASQAEQRGAGEILLTSWDQDGSRAGYDLPLIASIANAVSIPIIASGGADSAKHMAEAFDAGASAVLAASIFHDANTTVTEIKAQLISAGQEIRP